MTFKLKEVGRGNAPLLFSMIYGKIYQTGERHRYWTMLFKTKKLYDASVKLLQEVRKDRVCKHTYQWKWDRWQLEGTRKISDFPKDLRPFVKDSPVAESPNDVIAKIERLHRFWDENLTQD